MDGRTPGQQQLYDAGRRGDASPTHLGGNERDAFEQGRRDRNKNRWSEPTGEGGGGSLILGLVILGTLGVMLAIAASAAIAAFASAVLLYFLSRLWPGLPSQGYWEAYRTTFVCLVVVIVLVAAPLVAAQFLVKNLRTDSSYFAYVVETTPVILGSLLTRLGAPASVTIVPLETWLQWVATWRPDSSRVATWASVLLFAPAAVGAMIVAAIRIEFRSAIAAVFGSVAVAVLAILPGAAVAIWSTYWLIHNAQLANLSGVATLGTAALASGLLILAYALLGAVMAGLVLLAVLKLSRKSRHESFWPAYRTSFLGLAACGIVTLLALFWFRGGDALWAWSAGVAANDSLALRAIDFASLWQATAASWPVIVPGLLVAGAIVSARHPSPFAGMLGYGVAVAVAAVTAVPLLVLCLVAGAELARSGLLG